MLRGLQWAAPRFEGHYLEGRTMVKHFSEADIVCGGIAVDQSDLVDAPLWWHKQGLQQTASGYGKRLTCATKISYCGKLYRLYATCYGNAASVWFMVKGQRIHVR